MCGFKVLGVMGSCYCAYVVMDDEWGGQGLEEIVGRCG